MSTADKIVEIVKQAYGDGAMLPLHAPVFDGNERTYVLDTIDSTFVSSVGAYVDKFERMLCDLTGAKHAIATNNGTTALQIALLLADVQPGDLVITQALSFVATANAISHVGALPAFVDVDADTLGMSPLSLQMFLESECELIEGGCLHRRSGRRVRAVVPMHTFGLPCRMNELLAVSQAWSLVVVEDAAEALGSEHQGQACGTFGHLASLSFNGNKICTTGGGGAVLTDDPALGRRAKHLTTTAKLPHRWRFTHDEVGFNYRMPNINAALGCAQLERLPDFLTFKRMLAERYQAAFAESGIPFMAELPGCRANYWLCAILLSDEAERDACLAATNDAGVMTRPVWDPLHTLPMYQFAPCAPLPITENIAARLINLPSGYRSERA